MRKDSGKKNIVPTTVYWYMETTQGEVCGHKHRSLSAAHNCPVDGWLKWSTRHKNK